MKLKFLCLRQPETRAYSGLIFNGFIAVKIHESGLDAPEHLA